MADRFYTEKEIILGITEYKEILCLMSVEIHNSVSNMSEKFYAELRRRNYTTPTSYLELIKTYIEMLSVQRTIVPEKITRYEGGL